MARVGSFKARPRTIRLHPTTVVCTYSSATADNGKVLLQLDTHGSQEREMPNKLSQTLQLDDKAGRELWEILGKTFNLK